jgi:hypothetical protein
MAQPQQLCVLLAKIGCGPSGNPFDFFIGLGEPMLFHPPSITRPNDAVNRTRLLSLMSTLQVNSGTEN